MKNAAVILAGGKGSRMKSRIKKQYLPLDGKPLLYYALKTFNDSPSIDIIVLVTEEETFCRKELIEPFKLTKVKYIVSGGKERRDSVLKGLKALKNDAPDMVLIHDGARPFADEAIIRDGIEKAKEKGGSVAAVPVKDTIKVAREDGTVKETPKRSTLYAVQTPQTFMYDVILRAYEAMEKNGDETSTDDAMTVEKYGGIPVAFSRGDYRNIKVTTPEDMQIAEVFLKEIKKSEKNSKGC